ncbi:MAG: nicotinate phosphoribosyltransferase [Acidobacteriota bacterium]
MKEIENKALLTDLYELTMAASYWENKMFAPATFSLFIRNYPPGRNYFVSAGLEDVLRYLENLSFTSEELDYLAGLKLFKESFLSFLEKFRFSGDVWAIPEGRIFFANEPVMEITAPIIESQIVETFIINAVNVQVLLATKAARCFYAAQGRKLVDFSLRRCQGIDAGMKAARASYMAGFIGTSNVMSGKVYGIPVYGTMAHSYISSFPNEMEAFQAYARSFPENMVLLVDTYDTIEGCRKAAQVGKQMKGRGHNLLGIRLDSGDMAQFSRGARQILDREGLKDTQIFASGAFDEHKIQKILKEKAEIDSFGVGTKMGVSADAPYSDMAYKLVKYDGQPVLKLSTGKKILTSDKQIFRFKDKKGNLVKDVIGLRQEKMDRAESLLSEVMKEGKITARLPQLKEIREIFQEEFKLLEERYKSLSSRPPLFPVEISPSLKSLQKKVIQKVKIKELGES